jgi:Lipid A 3-O-deacylase (PagL)
MLVVLLFASFGLLEHCMLHAQEINPTDPAKTESSASHSGSSTLPEDPTDDTGDADDSGLDANAIAVQPQRMPRRLTPAREIAIQGFVSYGNWQIFAAGESESLYTAGIEYDRNSWGYFAGAQMDYIAEVLPFVLLRQPRVLDKWGHRKSKDDVFLPGFGFSPIGLRMQWRSDKAIKPYFNVKGGAVAFTQKALSPDASYYAFSLSESVGFYTRISERWDMRVGLFGDYHFSNAYITSYNPGLDVMNTSFALSYHLGGRSALR